MELIDLLDEQIGRLLDEVSALRSENRSLREKVASDQHKVDEIAALQAELAQERKTREQALGRVDEILRRIQTGLDNA